MKAVMTHVGLQNREHCHQVLPLFRPGFQPVHRKGMTEIVDPGPFAHVGYPCPPQETPEVFVDVPQRHRPTMGSREKECIFLREWMHCIPIFPETFQHGCRYHHQPAMTVFRFPYAQTPFFEIHIADHQQPGLRTTQPAFKQKSEKNRHDQMSAGTCRTEMAGIGLRKETDQFVLRIDIRDILQSRRRGILRQDIGRTPGAVQVFGELPDDRGP